MSADGIYTSQALGNAVSRAVQDMPQTHPVQHRGAVEGVDKHRARQVRETQQDVAQEVRQATEQLNQIMDTFDKGLRFRIHKESERSYVQVVNKRTDEVIREWPPEELLDVIARLHDVIGMLVDREG